VNALEVCQTYAMPMLMMPCSSFSYSNTRGVTFCKRGKRHQVCGGPCGVLVTREIKEEGSLGLSGRLREGKG
jgi:hypothetical protein